MGWNYTDIRGRIQKDMQYRDELHVHIVLKINVQLSVHAQSRMKTLGT